MSSCHSGNNIRSTTPTTFRSAAARSPAAHPLRCSSPLLHTIPVDGATAMTAARAIRAATWNWRYSWHDALHAQYAALLSLVAHAASIASRTPPLLSLELKTLIVDQAPIQTPRSNQGSAIRSAL
ncbi:hypothetical protein B0H13DRAFT_2303214 [Mycena leptocephala]|nr:hypothetical protein B0H13DRAFT_2303214 [Mycena leptocephala]